MKIKQFVSKAAMACLLLTGLANAQVGPDIVVHQLGVDGGNTNDIRYWGTANGIRAYSLATQSCNIGDQTVLWQSNNINHPVIGQSMYRLKNGRFEQIGQSWLKHGFCAVSEPGCGSCQATPCSTLGIGCADTYWASLNDGSSGGPKHEISPTTGRITYPYSSPSGPSAIRGRLQVAEEDINPSQNAGAVYFGSSLYISEHDQMAGNGANNGSWRKLNVVSVTNIDGNGPTNVGQGPLYAWRSEVPGVSVIQVQNDNEGGAGVHGWYHVAYNHIDNNDGTFTYNYVVYNHNSEQGCGDFSIPVNDGAELTNVYFNDVVYHSGEIQDNTDWTHTIANGEIRWEATTTYNQNANGNAIRWGTSYSFGFTTAAAPQDVTATMGMYGPGVSSALTAPVQGPGTPPDIFNYCTSTQNSSGGFAQIYSSGSNSIAANDLVLGASPVPVSQFGIFYYGPNEIEVPFGNGVRCVGGGVTRLPVEQSDNFFNIMHSVDNSSAPHSNNITPGSTWKFQCWFRDPPAGGSTFNLSTALSVTFQN